MQTYTKEIVILRDFQFSSALFGWVSYNDPCFSLGEFDEISPQPELSKGMNLGNTRRCHLRRDHGICTKVGRVSEEFGV